ncbi:flagellar hook-basal body protein [Clostridia bacterium OttesenSCG-928-F22]|nr:flagellar hook-basal body protein [Clostridia bacterium OttesenSCG-928-F22]
MMQASFSAKAALLAQQKRMDTIGNNMANVDTKGFKARNVSFQDLLYTKMTKPVGDQQENLQRGTGVRVIAMDYDFVQGAPTQTGNSLDFYLDGEGFFTVESRSGETLYTRNGAFALSVEEDGRYLTTAEGYYVLDTNGDRIAIPEGALDKLSVSSQGRLSIEGSEGFADLGMVTFSNIYGLEAVGNNCYAQTAASGGPVVTQETTTVRNSYLESSNVDMAKQMTDMIRTSRAFSFASRAATTADEMDAIANNMRT